MVIKKTDKRITSEMIEAFDNGDYDNPMLTNIFDELEIKISELGLDRELSENFKSKIINQV